MWPRRAKVAGAGFSWWLTRGRESRPGFLWTCAWAFLFASMSILVIGGRSEWARPAIHLLGPFFPALLLGGTLAYAERSVPRWLFPLAFALGVARFTMRSRASSRRSRSVGGGSASCA